MDGAEVGLFEALENFGKITQQHTAQLQILAGGDIAAAIFAVALHNGPHNTQLLCGKNSVGDAQAQHEFARCFGAPEHPIPLESELQIGLVDLLPADLCKFFDFAANQQAILGGLVLLDLVEFFAFEVGPGRSAAGHGEE